MAQIYTLAARPAAQIFAPANRPAAQIFTFANRPPGLFHGLLTRRMLAEAFGVSARTIRRYEQRGLPVSRLGGLRLYDVVRVNGWVRDILPAARLGYLMPARRASEGLSLKEASR